MLVFLCLTERLTNCVDKNIHFRKMKWGARTQAVPSQPLEVLNVTGSDGSGTIANGSVGTAYTK